MKCEQNIISSLNYIQMKMRLQLLLFCLDEIFLVEITREWKEDNVFIRYPVFYQAGF